MLFYQPPFLMVDAVTIFPDHADPETYYYIVAIPELVKEGTTPSFWATAILPPADVSATAGQQEVGRAIVSLDVHLPFPAALEETVRKEITKRWGREAKRLVPAPLSKGTASLSVARPNATEASKEFFVYEGHSPSLIGDNRAAFALAAEGKEAQALVAAMSVGHIGAVVTYDLEFPGLAPSFEATMKVHWKAVYKKFREREVTNGIFVNEEVDNTIERLKEDRAIEIEVKELDPDGAKAATKALFDELKSQVMKKLFETPRPSGEVPIEERIGRGVREVLTSILPGTSHSLVNIDQRSLSDTVINLREQQVNAYKYYPQSTLAGLVERAGGVTDRLQFVRTDELPHRTEEVIAEMASGAGRLGIKTVLVRVEARAPGKTEALLDETVRFVPETPERKSLRFRRNGTAEPVVRHRAEMILDGALAPGGKERWEFDWRPVTGNRIWFNPEEWLDVAEVKVEVDDPAVFDASRVDMEVEAWFPGEARPLRKEVFTFTKDAPTRALALVVPEDKQPLFKGREIFRRVGEADFVREIASIGDGFHRIMNPFGQSWTMEVRAVSVWADLQALFAEFRVWDVTRRTWLRAEQKFTKDVPVFTLKFAASLDTPRRAEARVTRVNPDGGVIRGPWKDLAGAVVAFTDQIEAKRRVRLTLAAQHFAAIGARRVSVDLEYKDDVHRVSETTSLDLSRDGAIADWVHAFPDPSRPLFRYKVRARGLNGERYQGQWAESGADDLTITLPDQPWE